jgi:hypothetical protein
MTSHVSQHPVVLLLTIQPPPNVLVVYEYSPLLSLMREEFDDIYLFLARFSVRHDSENRLRQCQLVHFNETFFYLERGNQKQDTQCKYVQRNIEALSLSHSYSGKTIIITYHESVFEVLGIQHANHVRHSFICCLPRSTVFFHIIS